MIVARYRRDGVGDALQRSASADITRCVALFCSRFGHGRWTARVTKAASGASERFNGGLLRLERLFCVARGAGRLGVDGWAIGHEPRSPIHLFWFILTGTRATLGLHHKQVQTAQDAAQALVPIASPVAGYLFAHGLLAPAIVAVPVLAATSSYIVSQEFG